MGLHQYGKRSRRRDKQLITRKVPAIVSEDTWAKAQQTLKRNYLFSPRNGQRNRYLLRGLVKCGICGLNYSGNGSGTSDTYYRCNGYQCGRGHFGKSGHRCPSKAVRADHLEDQIWSDIQRFLTNPGPLLQEIQARLHGEQESEPDAQVPLKRLEALLAEKSEEKTRVVSLFRRGRIDELALDEQMAEIGAEETAVKEQIDQLRLKANNADAIRDTLDSAEALLGELRVRLDNPVSWELKRELIEILVASIRVETVENDGIEQVKITANYRFSDPGESAQALLAQEYFLGGTQQTAFEPKTIGDHIRLRRLRLKLLQRDVAQKVGAKVTSIYNWENNRSEPDLRFIPAIFEFLGYDPLPEATTLGEQLTRTRISRGLNRKEAAREIGVDPSTLARWERGERVPTGRSAVNTRRFLVGQNIQGGNLS